MINLQSLAANKPPLKLPAAFGARSLMAVRQPVCHECPTA